jgi:phage terminase large subunit
MRGQFFNTILFNNFADIVFKIDPSKKEAISDFTNTKEASDGTKDKAKEKDSKSGVSYQKHGHISDATDYLLCYAFRTEFETFQRGDVTQYSRPMGRSSISNNRM